MIFRFYENCNQGTLDEKKASSNIIPVIALVICVLVFFCKTVFSGKALYGSDFVLQFYPWKNYIYDYVWSNGTIPFWNPYLFSGTPFIANIQASMFYPLGFLYYLLPTEAAYTYSTILHCILGSIFMYAFMRTLSISRAGSFLSAIIFTFNGFFMGHLYAGHLTFVQSYIWIPLIFLFLHRFILIICYKNAAITALVLGIQILGGFPQIAFYTILGILAFGLFYEIGFIRGRGPESALKLAFGLIAILLAGFALASVQILPTLEFTGLSTRAGGLGYTFATYDSLHPKELLSFLIPDIFGNVVDDTYWLTCEGWHSWETCGYVGIVSLCLILFSKRKGQVRTLQLFFLSLCMLSLLLALGRYNPIYPIIFKLPGFNNFRIPAQIIFLYVYGMSVLAGMGISNLSKEDMAFTKGSIFFLILVGSVLLFVYISFNYFHFQFFSYLFKNFAEGPMSHVNLNKLYTRMSSGIDRSVLLFLSCVFLLLMKKNRVVNSRLFTILINGLLMIDLGLFGIQFIKSYDFFDPPEKLQIIKQLNRNPAKGRIVTISNLFRTNDGVVYRFPSVSGYDPLILRRYVYYIQASQGQPKDDHVVNLARIDHPEVKLIRMLNVRQVVRDNGLVPVANSNQYATLVNKKVIRRNDKVLAFMMKESFDPNAMVVLESGPVIEVGDKNDGHDYKATCQITDYSDEDIRLKTASNKPGYLVLSEIYYPGWKAKVDGKDVQVTCGNYLFRVVPIESGEHVVHLYFVSRPFRLGLILSVLTLLFLLGLIVRDK